MPIGRLTTKSKFYIDLGYWEQTGRNFREELYDLLCDECKQQFTLDQVQIVDHVDPQTGQVVRMARHARVEIPTLVSQIPWRDSCGIIHSCIRVARTRNGERILRPHTSLSCRASECDPCRDAGTSCAW